MKVRNLLTASVALAGLLFLSGCFGINIKNDIDYPADLFAKKRERIRNIEAKNPGRKGPVKKIKMMVYVEEDRELVSLSIPKGLTRLIPDLEEEIYDYEEVKKHGKSLKLINLKKLTDLDRFGPGLLAEIQVDEKNERVHLLIWLE
jgi:hypothetical protein